MSFSFSRWWKSVVAFFEKLANDIPEVPTPDPTPTPPPDPTPAPKLTYRKVWSRGFPWVTMFAKQQPDTSVLVSVYDRVSRHDSELRLLQNLDGTVKDKRIHKGDEETLGEVQGTNFIAAERGDNVLKYEDGKLTKHTKLNGEIRHNVTGCIWRGRAVIAAGYGDKNPAKIMDCVTGEVLGQAPRKGLISQMCEDPKGVLWLSCVEGKAVLSFDGTKWEVYSGIEPASVAFWPALDTIVAGSMRDGKVYRLIGRSWEQIADFKCSKINRLIVSVVPHSGESAKCLVAAGSNPDTYGYVRPFGSERVLLTLGGEKQKYSGEQFDAGINAIEGGFLVWRRADNGTEVGILS